MLPLRCPYPQLIPQMKIRLFSALLLTVPGLALIPVRSFAAAANPNPPGGPTVTVNEPVAVTVAGPVEIQGSVEVLNDALKTVYNRTITGSVSGGVNGFIQVPALPSGKRLVIETISVWVQLAAGQKATAFLFVSGQLVGATVTNGSAIALPLTSQGLYGSDEFFTGVHKVRVVVDPRINSSMSFNIYRTGTAAVPVSCSFAGYLEDIPATP
jgi:hypothetical protein